MKACRRDQTHPVEEAEACTGLEDEEREDLLQSETDDDGLPSDSFPVVACQPAFKRQHATTHHVAVSYAPEAELEHKKSEDRDRPIRVLRALRQIATKSRSEHQRQQAQPADTKASTVRKFQPGSGDEGGPELFDGTGDDFVWDVLRDDCAGKSSAFVSRSGE